MSVYMTEAEQLEIIKKWWLRHQNLITVCLALVVCVVAGYRYWNWHVEKTMLQASTAYQNMMAASSTHDDKGMQSYANQLIHDNDKTVYATAAHLLLAKIFVNQKEYQKAELELAHVAQHAKVLPLQQLAKIRLARLQLSQKQYDKALAELATIKDSPYTVVVNELKGDIYSAKGDYLKADASYQSAMNDLASEGGVNLLLEMKHNEVKAMIGSQSNSKTA